MKCFVSSNFTILLRFAYSMKRHVMVVYLVFSCVWISTVVSQPSIIKSPATIAGYEMTELSNGNLQIRESGFEESIFVFRPNSSNGIESAQLGKDSGMELNGSGYTPSLFLAPSGKSMISQSGKKNADDTYQCDGYCALYITLPVWIMAYLTAMGYGCTTFDIRGAVKRPA